VFEIWDADDFYAEMTIFHILIYMKSNIFRFVVGVGLSPLRRLLFVPMYNYSMYNRKMILIGDDLSSTSSIKNIS